VGITAKTCYYTGTAYEVVGAAYVVGAAIAGTDTEPAITGTDTEPAAGITVGWTITVADMVELI
jgi:hypothetical protein